MYRLCVVKQTLLGKLCIPDKAALVCAHRKCVQQRTSNAISSTGPSLAAIEQSVRVFQPQVQGTVLEARRNRLVGSRQCLCKDRFFLL